MAKSYTRRQYEPLIAPARWGEDEQRFVRQLTDRLDEIYRKLGVSDTSAIEEEIAELKEDAVFSVNGELPDDAGNVVIEAEKGDKGDPGEPGPQGEPGQKGDKGDPGDSTAFGSASSTETAALGAESTASFSFTKMLSSAVSSAYILGFQTNRWYYGISGVSISLSSDGKTLTFAGTLANPTKTAHTTNCTVTIFYAVQ